MQPTKDKQNFKDVHFHKLIVPVKNLSTKATEGTQDKF